MKLLTSYKLFLLAFCVVILSNIVVLVGVYLNRSGEPTSEIVLTQRELALPYRYAKENSAISLSIIYRTENAFRDKYLDYNAPEWLNEVKLKELGFNIAKYNNPNSHRNRPTKEVFLVLQYNGEAYRESLKLREEGLERKAILLYANKKIKRDYEDAKNNLEYEKVSASRLFAIDAGLNYEVLRQKYSNKTKYMIVKGLIILVHKYKKNELYGRIQELSVKNIHVPYEFKHIFKNIKTKVKHGRMKNRPPQYKVVVKYGSSYEPWIDVVNKIESR